MYHGQVRRVPRRLEVLALEWRHWLSSSLELTSAKHHCGGGCCVVQEEAGRGGRGVRRLGRQDVNKVYGGIAGYLQERHDEIFRAQSRLCGCGIFAGAWRSWWPSPCTWPPTSLCSRVSSRSCLVPVRAEGRSQSTCLIAYLSRLGGRQISSRRTLGCPCPSCSKGLKHGIVEGTRFCASSRIL